MKVKVNEVYMKHKNNKECDSVRYVLLCYCFWVKLELGWCLVVDTLNWGVDKRVRDMNCWYIIPELKTQCKWFRNSAAEH